MTRLNRRSILLTGLAGGIVACTTTPAASGPPVVETTGGKVQGLIEGSVRVFKGIPYGASTAGQGRFRPPRAPAPWTGVKETIAYGPPTPQGQPSTAPPPPP